MLLFKMVYFMTYVYWTWLYDIFSLMLDEYGFNGTQKLCVLHNIIYWSNKIFDWKEYTILLDWNLLLLSCQQYHYLSLTFYILIYTSLNF